MKKRIPTSITRIGTFTVKVYDEQAYAENIRRYYANDAATATPRVGIAHVPFEKKKTSARYDWASWHEPMIKGQSA